MCDPAVYFSPAAICSVGPLQRTECQMHSGPLGLGVVQEFPGDWNEDAACRVPVCLFCESSDQVVWVRSSQQLACLQFDLDRFVFAVNVGIFWE